MKTASIDRMVSEIVPVDTSLEPRVREKLDSLTKPPGSLGRLEDLAVRYCLATGTTEPRIARKVIFTCAGDHGVASRGVSAYPPEVTPQMVRNMLSGGAAVNVLARHAGAEVHVVDVGVNDPLEHAEGLVARKVRPGTADMTEGPAMSRGEAERAVAVGFDLAREAAPRGGVLLGTGEMGIANTTPASALFAALLPCRPGDIAGRGTGIDDERLARKVRVIERALEVNADRLTDPLNTLAAVGGLEIAALCGLVLGAASRRSPVVVDGFISSAAALAACRMCPHVRGYLFFGHLSAEAGHARFFECFGTRPILDLGMRLGEGTGAALAMFVVEAAVKIYTEMATFDSAGVSGREGGGT